MSNSLHADPPPKIVREPNGIQYVTADQLGKGGFAICYRAEQCERNMPTGKTVALKIVKSQMEPQKLAQKFVTELQLHSKLRHPNIVEFFRAFSFEKNTYVVLEVCDNGSLADALKKRKFFTMPEIRRFLIQICGAVKYLHHRNIVHRDLKTGNLFLDNEMNIKVGDFGLAAVLVGKNEVGLRRTTMCGTPNYLAPEILEKHGKGHNEKVDLWAIGIIAYTLAVGKAPFHASKREEIYKKLQQREYAWPDLKKHQNCISYDLQDLVGSLLVDEDNRPVPDQIVSHQFFKLHWVPERLSSSWTTNAPDFPNNTPPGAAEIAQGYSWSWHQACKRSGVGEYSPGCTFPVVGLGNIASIFKDIEKEIKAGRAPTVPIAPTTVYLPFISEQREKTLNRTRHVREAVDDVSSSQNSSRLAEISGNNADTITRMLPIRRAPSRRYKENVDPEVLQPIQSGSKPVAAVTNIKKRVTSRTQDEKPLIKTQVYLQSTLDSRPQVARERTQSSSQLPRQRSVRQKERALPVKEPRLLETDIKRNSQPQSQDGALEIVATNDPTRVLQRATRLRDQLLFALQCKSRPQRSDVQHQTLPFVSKWVDYAKKHGVGYVLSDGTIGCAFNATSRQSVMHVVVRNGYTYLDRNKEDPKPESRIPLQFFSVDESGGLHVSKPEGDLWKRNAVLWSKFGRYMCQTLTIGSERKPAIDNTAEGPIVRYYQRIGPVGIWGFSDGCLQANFPDHTKIVISADGEFCNFTCLTEDSIKYLEKHGDLPIKYVKQRDVLSSSPNQLLNGSSKASNQAKANLLELKLRFISDVLDLWVQGDGLGCRPRHSTWPVWTGPKLDDAGGKKIDWVTVGRFGGDINESPVAPPLISV